MGAHSTADLLHIESPAIVFDTAYSQTPGGYAWWYVDLIDNQGRVAVLILAYGLPFLPGYRQRTLEGGEGCTPEDWASLNLAIYENGKPTFFTLTQFPAAEAARDFEKDTWTFGRSVFRRVKKGADFQLEGELDLDTPGGDRVKGTLKVRGTARKAIEGSFGGGGLRPHVWSPQTGPARGTLELHSDTGMGLKMSGRAYQDQNAGAVPLWDLGMASWIWARFPHPDHEEILYLVWPKGEAAPRAVRVCIDAQGRTTVVEGGTIVLGKSRRTYAGMHYPSWVRIEGAGQPGTSITFDLHAPFDVGPFYLRFCASRTRDEGEEIRGIAERCVPENIDRGWQRPFVNMRVQQAAGPNSMWLPLFDGPRGNRYQRLVRKWLKPPGEIKGPA